jgi:hypothetical protein
MIYSVKHIAHVMCVLSVKRFGKDITLITHPYIYTKIVTRM